MKITCHCCDEEFAEDDIRYAFSRAYCENCFSELFTYCSRCDEVFHNDDIHYTDSGYAYCSSCYDAEEEEYDPSCPNNPDVDEMDRKHIINLSRNWLKGEIENRRPIYINKNDYLLKVIRAKVGLIEDPIYVFGLTDRDEYQISASPNLMEDVKEAALLNLPDAVISEGHGINRLGISYSLRKNNLKEVVDLIKALTVIKVPA